MMNNIFSGEFRLSPGWAQAAIDRYNTTDKARFNLGYAARAQFPELYTYTPPVNSSNTAPGEVIMRNLPVEAPAPIEQAAPWTSTNTVPGEVVTRVMPSHTEISANLQHLTAARQQIEDALRNGL